MGRLRESPGKQVKGGKIMMQDEFEKMIGKTVTPEDYSNIELVYTFYPGDMMK